MAAATKKSGNSSSGRSRSTQRRSPAGSSAPRSASSSRSKKNAKKTPLLTLLKDSSVGRFLLIIVSTICVLGLDFLISLNQFDRFFLLLGIELIALVLIGWIRFVLRGRSDEDD